MQMESKVILNYSYQTVFTVGFTATIFASFSETLTNCKTFISRAEYNNYIKKILGGSLNQTSIWVDTKRKEESRDSLGHV